MRFFISLLLLLILSQTGISRDPEWLIKMKQIKLLTDSRSDILKLLGSPVDNKTDDYLWYYDLKGGRLFITYETGTCSENLGGDGKPIGWKVPKWSVVELSFSPDKPINPKKIGIKFDGFTKLAVNKSSNATPNDNERAPFLFRYINKDLGIYYFEEYGKISEIRFMPSEKFDYLRCQ